MRRKWIIVLAPVLIALFVVIGGEVVLHLWNWLLPALFGWRQISFWQAVGVAGSLPDSVRRRERPWLSSSKFPPPDGGAMGADDARRA